MFFKTNHFYFAHAQAMHQHDYAERQEAGACLLHLLLRAVLAAAHPGDALLLCFHHRDHLQETESQSLTDQYFRECQR